MAKSKNVPTKKAAPKKAAKKTTPQKVKYKGESEAIDPLETGTSLGELEVDGRTEEQKIADVLNNKAVN